MAVSQTINLLLLLTIATFGLCYGAVYKVGDSVGWTNKGYGYYQNWTSTKYFEVGDTLVFQYDPKEDNVMQVSRRDFHSCDIEEPMLLYISGNDSITMKGGGHHYYVSGTHCRAGLKVDVRVLPLSHNTTNSAPTPSPSVSAGPAPSLCTAASLFCHHSPPTSAASSNYALLLMYSIMLLLHLCF